MNKNSFIGTLFTLCLLLSLSFGNQCTQNVDPLGLTYDYECDDNGVDDLEQRTFDASSLELGSGVKQLTVFFDIKITEFSCLDPGSFSYFIMTIQPEGEDERKIIEMTWTDNSPTFSYYLDNALTLTVVLSDSMLDVQTTHFFTFDLEQGLVKAGFKNINTFDNSLSRNDFVRDWVFDSTLKFYICTDMDGVNGLGCQLSNLQVVPTYIANPSNLLFGIAPILIGDYKFDDLKNQQIVLNSASPIGNINLGTSITSPTWHPALSGVQMSTTTYFDLPSLPISPIYSFMTGSYSLTISMWIKIDALPTSDDHSIFRYSSSEFERDVFAVLITANGEIKVSMLTLELVTTASISESQWALLSVSFAYQTVSGRGQVRMQVMKDNANIGSYPDTFTTAFTMPNPDFVRVGGFDGALTNLKIMSPGSFAYNTPSCSSSCLMDIGFNTQPQCLIPRTCDIGCQTCTGSGATCLACSDGFYLHNSACLPQSLLIGCREYEDTGCKTCIAGFYKYNSKCFYCAPGCASCADNTGVCSSCSTEYYMDGSVCLPQNSLKGCQSPVQTGCDLCESGFYKVGSKCFACAPGCASCAEETGICSTCSNGYYLESSECLPQSSLKGCQTPGQSGCNICKSGFYKVGPKCFNCAPGCASCAEETGVCLTCSTGYYMEGSECLPTDSLIGCKTPGQKGCELCKGGYYKDGSKCFPCTVGCETCLGSGASCLTCSFGFYSENSRCLTWSSLLGCQEYGGTGCDDCKDGFYKDGSKCFPCVPGCQKCTGSRRCSNCAAGFYLENEACLSHSSLEGCNAPGQIGCVDCKDGFYKDNSKCFSCAFGCEKCTESGATCQACKNGFYLDQGGCFPCRNLEGCDTCTETGCQSCLDGFYLQNSKCFIIAEESGLSKGGVVGVTIAVTLVVVAIAILVFLLIKKRLRAKRLMKIYSQKETPKNQRNFQNERLDTDTDFIK